MKSPIYINTDQKHSSSFWITGIIDGISAYAAERRLKCQYIQPCQVSDGEPIILIGTDEGKITEQTYAIEAQGGIPLIINAVIPDSLRDRHSVSFSLDRSIHECVDYLSSIGKKRLALVGVSDSSASDLMKKRIFSGLTQSSLIISADREGGIEEAVNSFVASLPSVKCDGAICSSDTVAILLISRLLELGINVGTDIAVIGMGNSHIGRHMSPSLTTVNFDYHLLGREAAKLYQYISRQGGELCSAYTCTLPTKLIVRGSTASLPFIREAKKTVPDYSEESVFKGSEVLGLIKLEDLLQNCDSTDSEIIFNSHKTYRELAEGLFLSERTLKYRMSHILSRLGFSSKEELSTFLGKLL